MDRHALLFIAIGIGVASFFAILAIVAAGRKPVFRKKGQLLLLNEQRFLAAALQAIPPDTLLTAKVRLLDLVSTRNEKTGKSMDRAIEGLSVDFVLINRATSEVRLCIEMIMEGRSVGTEALLARALRKAGIPHLKLPLVRYYDPVRLRQIIMSALYEGDAPD